MMNKNGVNILAGFADWLGEVFERLSPAMFRMLSTVLPYITPIPVAWLTAKGASTFLGFTSGISTVFVVMLEGIGLWATTELVDAFVEAIRSRNKQAWGVVAFLGGVVLTYLALLISLNVTLERAIGNVSPTYSLVISLICFLPFIAGCLNGYRKVKTETKTNIQMEIDRKNEQEQEQWKIKENNKQQVRLAKAGINPLAPAYQAETPQVKLNTLKTDWRLLTQAEKKACKGMDYKDIMSTYQVGESTAHLWKKRSNSL